MAVITLNKDKDTVTVLIESSDLIRSIEKRENTVAFAGNWGAGHVFVNEEIPLCMIRGERK